jgi:hypothetical protein
MPRWRVASGLRPQPWLPPTQVLGAPLAGSEVRAYVLTGGGLYLSRHLTPKVLGEGRPCNARGTHDGGMGRSLGPWPLAGT